MTGSKDASRKVSKLAQHIALSVSKSVETRQSQESFSMPVHVLAALTATKEYVNFYHINSIIYCAQRN